MPSLDDGTVFASFPGGSISSGRSIRERAQAVVAVVGVVPVQSAIGVDVAGVVGRAGTKKQGIPRGPPHW